MRFLQFLTAVSFAATAGAQTRRSTQLSAELSPASRATIEHILDSARVIGLPIAPLSDKTYEGVLKGADDRRIVSAVQALFHQLIEARDILGSANDVTLLGAVASALQAGVSSTDIRHIVNPSPGSQPDAHALAGALVTVVDLVAKRVPPASASSAIAELLRRRATEAQFVALRNDVEQDILNGQLPEAALASRTRAYVKALDASPDRPLPRRPPPPL